MAFLPRRKLACLLLMAGISCADAAWARIELQISHVGFPAIGHGDIIRAGCWTPVYVDISLLDQPSFDGVVRIGQLDTDGDEAFDSMEVHVRAETGGHARVILYIPSNPNAADGRFAVELFDMDGSIVQVISDGVPTMRATPSQNPETIPHDDIVVLSVADSAIGKVKDLSMTQQGGGLRQRVEVAHISPADLPEQWVGLDSIDYVVWEDAKPEALTARQLSSLIEWCKHGGTLLISASETAASFRLVKPFSEILPADVSEVGAALNLPNTRRVLLGAPAVEEQAKDQLDNWLTIPFPQQVSIGLAKARSGSTVVVQDQITNSAGNSISSDVVTRSRVGRGQVILSTVRMRDLFSAPGAAHKFFERLFHMIPVSGQIQGGLTPVSLFRNVTSSVGFVRSRSAYLVITILFAITYVLLATWGTWAFLSARGWRQHSWTAFAVLAITAGVGAGMAVGAARGITDRLQQIAIIDSSAGETFGRATAFFGLKTGIDKKIDLWLPSDWLMAKEPEASACSLRPLPAGMDWRSDSSFADPDEYSLRPASAEIDDARFRATLKRFEGRWEGPLGGQLTGRIAVRNGLPTEDSYIINNLGVELAQCRLVYSSLDPGAIASDRSQAIYVLTVKGTVPSDGTKVYLYPRCFELSDRQTVRDIAEQSKLRNRHADWSKQFSGLLAGLSGTATEEAKAALGKEQEALMLLSTVGDFDDSVFQTRFGGYFTLSRDRLRQLDLREQLTAGRNADEDKGIPAQNTGSMTLVGFARGGGPIRLFARTGDDPYEAMSPEEDASWCMYRIALPFENLDIGRGEAESETNAAGAPEATAEKNP